MITWLCLMESYYFNSYTGVLVNSLSNQTLVPYWVKVGESTVLLFKPFLYFHLELARPLRLPSATRAFRVDCRVKLIGVSLEEGGMISS